jgi:hypothetical protein
MNFGFQENALHNLISSRVYEFYLPFSERGHGNQACKKPPRRLSRRLNHFPDLAAILTAFASA